MISRDLASRLRDAGLVWKPASGDQFTVPDRDLDDVFVLSDMTVELHDLPDGPVLGFNGTTEWALDDLAQEEALWLPREDQLRTLLGGTFQRLERHRDGYRLLLHLPDGPAETTAASPAEAYGEGLLLLIQRTH
ncbi:pilus assembly protein CpaE [Solwaraspora sp. WMMD1047]|uniref:pilus assembly protein CpaE n=1 Tax=Solwaraspora sp. WMMD1047 TaxID=3016102 RepID=UPI002417D2ED|nr:pilus assembly protein CpaE [Solwaraspora sp. WMMD1047]MDG4833206.1 pilus assembly protein CpaE [Solwaraspora sp. WMMD1047]